MPRHLRSIMSFAAGFAICTVLGGGYVTYLAKSTLSSPIVREVAAQAPSSSPQAATAFYEYRVVSRRQINKKTDEEMSGELTQLSAQGFDIYSVTQSSSRWGEYTTVVL